MKTKNAKLLPLALFAAIIMGGCASNTPPSKKPSMADYTSMAEKLHGLEACAALDFADPQILAQGIPSEINRLLGNSPNMQLLESIYNSGKEESDKAIMELAEYMALREDADKRNEEKEMLIRKGISECGRVQQFIIAEIRQGETNRRNYEIQNRAMNNIASSLSNMGNMALEAGSNAMQMTQPMIPSIQPSLVPGQNSGNSNYLINSPDGLIQRNCIPSGNNYNYCF